MFAVRESTDLMAEAAEESQREACGGGEEGMLLMTILLSPVKTGVRGHISE